MRGVLLLTPGAVQLSQLPPPSFHFPSTPICLLCALDLRPIQVHVCGSGPSHATLNPCKATGATLELTFQLPTLQATTAPDHQRMLSQPFSDPSLSCGLRGADKSVWWVIFTDQQRAVAACGDHLDEFKHPCG